jgi:hypothetical protein
MIAAILSSNKDMTGSPTGCIPFVEKKDESLSVMIGPVGMDNKCTGFGIWYQE